MFFKIYVSIFSFLMPIVMCTTYQDLDHTEIRKQFLDRKYQNKANEDRTKILDKSETTKEYLDGVVHYKISDNTKHKKWNKFRDIEKDFRRLLAMKGVTYNYKRDVFWRTWRPVMYANGKQKIICYKCNSGNGEMKDCKNCNGGTWTIEEKPPPCAFEFYSLIDDDYLCGANYTQYKDTKSPCPSRIKFSDLTATCDNPIETTWRFKRVFNHSKKYENIICNGRDYCEIFTTYTISPQYVIFRIINSSNVIIYSRIMKPKRNNYVCIEECGIYNPFTKDVKKNENPLRFNLLSTSIKKKREKIEKNVFEKILHDHLSKITGKIFEKKMAGIKKIRRIESRNVDKELNDHNMLDESQTTTPSHSSEVENSITEAFYYDEYSY